MLVELQSQYLQQFELDWDGQDAELPLTVSGAANLVSAVPLRDRRQLMTAMDEVNRRYGRGSLQLASAGVSAAPRSWSMKQERKTPRYTTEWDEMPIARA